VGAAVGNRVGFSVTWRRREVVVTA
jgi:hypothetical protein